MQHTNCQISAVCPVLGTSLCLCVAVRLEELESFTYNARTMRRKKRSNREKDPNAVALGKKGGKARAKKLTEEQLSEQGKKAALARWEVKPRKKKP